VSISGLLAVLTEVLQGIPVTLQANFSQLSRNGVFRVMFTQTVLHKRQEGQTKGMGNEHEKRMEEDKCA
jgi:hypothetical protein